MLLSPDFLLYMEATAALLDKDPTLWCVSSWNDNGLDHLEWKVDRLVQSCAFATSLPMMSVACND